MDKVAVPLSPHIEQLRERFQAILQMCVSNLQAAGALPAGFAAARANTMNLLRARDVSGAGEREEAQGEED